MFGYFFDVPHWQIGLSVVWFEFDKELRYEVDEKDDFKAYIQKLDI